MDWACFCESIRCTGITSLSRNELSSLSPTSKAPRYQSLREHGKRKHAEQLARIGLSLGKRCGKEGNREILEVRALKEKGQLTWGHHNGWKDKWSLKLGWLVFVNLT